MGRNGTLSMGLTGGALGYVVFTALVVNDTFVVTVAHKTSVVFFAASSTAACYRLKITK